MGTHHRPDHRSDTMRWLPLEANPDIFQEWTGSLGLRPDQAQFTDIYGLDPDLLAFVPRPVYAVLMLFPVTAPYEKARKERDALVKDEAAPKDILFFKQTIGNACGTMGILHAMGNIPVNLDESSALAQIFKDCKDKTPEERAAYLETSSHVEAAHSSAAQTGQSRVPDLQEDVDLHFSCFVAADVKGQQSLVELDGRRPGPIVHGPIAGDLLESAAEVVRSYIKLSESIQFNLIALTKPSED